MTGLTGVMKETKEEKHKHSDHPLFQLTHLQSKHALFNALTCTSETYSRVSTLFFSFLNRSALGTPAGWLAARLSDILFLPRS